MPEPLEASSEEVAIFDAYPPLASVVRGGGKAGVSYAYVLGQNMAAVRKDDPSWKLCHYARDFMVGDHGFVVLFKGTPIIGASTTSCIPELFVDPEADKLLGVKVKVDGTKKEAEASASA